MGKLLTISVAAYNVEKYLDKLFDSILKAKKINDIEVLIINDGSKDCTAEITKKYERQYPGIVYLIDKENGGHGSTINRGIKEASGKYFRALDGDDWLDTEGLNKLLNVLKDIDSDMILMDYKTCYEGGDTILEKVSNLDGNVLFKIDDVINKLPYMRYHSVIYKTTFLQEHNIELDEHCFYVDTEFMLYPLRYLETLIYLNWPLYCYRIGLGEQSVSSVGRKRHIEDSKKVAHCLLEFYNKLPDSIGENRKKYIENGIAAHCSFHLNSLLLFAPTKEIKQEIMSFDRFVKNISLVIYKQIEKESKSVYVLRKTNYILYKLIQKKKEYSES